MGIFGKVRGYLKPKTQKVNTVRVNGVNTARQTAVSTIKGNGVTVVKASASCVWRPQKTDLNNGSKDNSGSWILKRGNPQQALKYKGMFDSRCSRHMTGNKALLADYQEFQEKVYKVEKALYSLHQAPRAWYETLSTYLLDNEFHRGQIDKTLFIKRLMGDILLVQVYVDDIIFGLTKKSLCDEFDQIMHNRFQMSSMGELTFFLSLQVKQKEDGIFISQDKYVGEILKKFGFSSVRTASTPIKTSKALTKDEDGEFVDVHLYRSIIGSLMYLTSSRPGIMFSVCACLRFQVQPKVSHLNAVKRIFRYLKGQPKLGLWYPKDSPLTLEAFSNSDYAGASLDRKSITGGCQFLGSRLIFWQCKKQTMVANSITKAEYIAASHCCSQVLWIQNQMLDYGFNFMQTKIHVDNESAICVVKNHVYHSKTKHIEIRHHFIRDSYKKRLIEMGSYSDEAVHKELGDRMERAATTASSFEAAQDNCSGLSTTEDGVHAITATIDGRDKIITEASIRRHLKLQDSKGLSSLPNAEMFEQLARMGTYSTPTLTNKLFNNMRRASKGYSRVVTPLFDTMLVQPQGGAPSTSPSRITSSPSLSSYHTTSSTPTTPPFIQITHKAEETATMLHDSPLPGGHTPRSDEGRLQHTELMELITKLTDRIGALEKDLQQTNWRSKSEDEYAAEDHSKQGRKIAQIDTDLPYSVAEVRKNMVMYLKNQAGYKQSYFKGMKYEEIRPMFEKVWDQTHTFVPMDLEDKEKGTEKKFGGTRKKTLSRKRAGEKKSKESSKRQKNEDAAADNKQEKAKLRLWLKVAQDDEESVNPEILYTKYPIVNWEYQLLGRVGGKDFEVYKLTRADGSASHHGNIQAFLRRLDKEDLNKKDDIWMNQLDWKLLKWKLHENCGVHTLFMDGTPMQINMLVEKKYPLIMDLLEKMLNLQLEAEEESTMAFKLLKFIKSQIEEQ
ncbi:putative ribonuclease H-like domain-containing protein [Tanacetum coccineum]